MLTQRKPWYNTSEWLYAPSNKLGGEDVFYLFCHLISLPSPGLKPQKLQASWQGNQDSLPLLIIFFPLAALPSLQADKNCASLGAPLCLWEISRGVWAASIKGEILGEGSAGFLEIRLGWFLPNYICMCSGITLQSWASSKILSQCWRVLPSLQVPAEIPLLKGHSTRKLVSFQDATPERAFLSH